MQTLICPACGCSLVRLGIEKDRAAVYKYKFTRRPAKTYISPLGWEHINFLGEYTFDMKKVASLYSLRPLIQ
jgi:hypothetical protein